MSINNQTNDLTEEEAKDIINYAINYSSATYDEAMEYYKNMYGEIKGTKAYNLMIQAKGLAISSVLSWDSSKTTGQNIAYILGQTAAGFAIGLVAGPGIAGFIIGVILNESLKFVGIDFAQFSQDLYDYSLAVNNIQQQMLNDWNNMTPEQRALSTKNGIYPGSDKWLETLNQMAEVATNKLLEAIDGEDEESGDEESGDEESGDEESGDGEPGGGEPGGGEPGGGEPGGGEPGGGEPGGGEPGGGEPGGGIPFSISDIIRRLIDPVVIDINRDGYISMINYDDSNVFFDLNGDVNNTPEDESPLLRLKKQ